MQITPLKDVNLNTAKGLVSDKKQDANGGMRAAAPGRKKSSQRWTTFHHKEKSKGRR